MRAYSGSISTVPFPSTEIVCAAMVAEKSVPARTIGAKTARFNPPVAMVITPPFFREFT